MWRVVVAILVLGFVAYKFVHKRPSAGDAAAISADAYDGYIEVRMVMQGPQREIELVALEEHPKASECETKSAGARTAALCPSGRNGAVTCTVKSVECMRELEPRYLKMLDQKPASVHYAHIKLDDPSGAPRRGLILGWGMTEQESLLVCNGIRSAAGTKLKGTVTCI
jgi:hypothetical protein